MCVIIGLPKGITLPWLSLKNASLNNADGFGIIVSTDKKLEVIKKVNPKGNDPEDVQKLLEQFKDHDRFLHLRYATVGKTNNENAHPFTVLNKDGHRIEFMHNGTMSDYRPSVGSDNSDTLNFATNFLTPLFERLKDADPEDPFISSLIEGRMGAMSKGLLVSTHHGPCFLGKWKTIKSDEGTDIAVSNDDYFEREQTHRRSKYSSSDNTQRGPYQGYGHGHGGQSVVPFQPTKAPANEAGGAHERSSTSASTKTSAENIVDIAAINTSSPRGREIDPKEFAEYLETGDATLTDEAITWFSYLSTFETTNFAKAKPETFAILFENVVARFGDVLADKIELEDKLTSAVDKHKRASILISEQLKRIEELEGMLGNSVVMSDVA